MVTRPIDHETSIICAKHGCVVWALVLKWCESSINAATTGHGNHHAWWWWWWWCECLALACRNKPQDVTDWSVLSAKLMYMRFANTLSFFFLSVKSNEADAKLRELKVRMGVLIAVWIDRISQTRFAAVYRVRCGCCIIWDLVLFSDGIYSHIEVYCKIVWEMVGNNEHNYHTTHHSYARASCTWEWWQYNEDAL